MSETPPAPSPLDAAAVAAMVGGRLVGGEVAELRGLATPQSAGPTDVVFFRSAPDARGVPPKPELLEAVLACAAGLLLVDEAFPAVARPLCRVADPGLAAAKLQQHWRGDAFRVAPGIAPSAEVHPEAQVSASAAIAGGVQVGADCVVEDGVVLHPGVVLYARVRVGAGTVIHANTVVGSPGFGYVWDGQRHQPMPQVGGVEIGRGVEIGANVTIDAGTLEPTVIGDGCILDNLVQVAHNCVLGRAVVLCAQVGLSGSTILEDGVVMGGQSGSGGHVRVGAGTQVAGRGGITADIGPGRQVAGLPAVDLAEHQRMQAAVRRLARRRKGDAPG